MYVDCVFRHEIIGVVTKVGRDVKGFKEGDRVGVGCLAASCLECEHCKTDQENYCEKLQFVYNGVFWDGSITYGGYSQIFVADYRLVLVPSSFLNFPHHPQFYRMKRK